MSGSRRSTSTASLLLRLVLGVTFLWAGMGKVLGRMPVPDGKSGALIDMGVIAPDGGSPAAPDPGQPRPPERPLPSGEPENNRSEAPTPVTEPLILPTRAQAPMPQAAPQRTIARVYGLALLIRAAANPGPDENGKPRMRLWPKALGEGAWPVRFAWAVAMTELLGGAAVLLGLLTRLAAFLLAGTMLGAIWLTEIGPAIQSGGTVLGFLPDHAWDDPGAWKSLLWQCSLLASGLAVSLLGAGRVSLDAALFGGGSSAADHDDL